MWESKSTVTLNSNDRNWVTSTSFWVSIYHFRKWVYFSSFLYFSLSISQNQGILSPESPNIKAAPNCCVVLAFCITQVGTLLVCLLMYVCSGSTYCVIVQIAIQSSHMICLVTFFSMVQNKVEVESAINFGLSAHLYTSMGERGGRKIFKNLEMGTNVPLLNLYTKYIFMEFKPCLSTSIRVPKWLTTI